MAPKKHKKKGQMSTQVWGLVGLVVAIAVVGLVSAFTLQIMSTVSNDMTANTLEKNATIDAMEGIAEVASWQPTVATIGVAVIIISLLIGGLYFLVARGKR